MLSSTASSMKLHHKRNISNIAIAPCAIVMVGLPARGKTYMAKKLTRYFNWIGIETKVFNVGEYRRRLVTNFTNSAQFFHPDNIEANALREQCAKEALQDLCRWLHHGGEVAVYDATNSNRARRRMIYDYLTKQCGIRILFIESLCTDPNIIEANILEVKVSSPDYQTTDKDQAIEDFKDRIAVYETQYDTLDEEFDKNLSFIKIYNQGERYLINNIYGHIQSRAVYFLMNIHVLPRTVYLTRPGETDGNIAGKIAGGGCLSARGQQYAAALGKYVEEQHENLRVWTSLAMHAIDTTAFITNYVPQEHWKALNELDPGVAEDLTYEEFLDKYPEDYRKRVNDKYHYRFLYGESYLDVVSRLEPVIMELERQQNVLVVCDQAISRCILAYFLNYDTDELPYIDVPLHTVIKLTTLAYGCAEERINFGIDAVNTYVPRPQAAPTLSSQERKMRRKQASECQEPACCGS